MDDNLEAELERLRAENARLKHDRWPHRRPRKDATMQGDQRDPFGLAARPAEGCERAGPVPATSGPGRGSSPGHQRAIGAQRRDEKTYRG